MLCKCSGKYIDIYFGLKITFLSLFTFVVFSMFFEGLRSLGPFVAEVTVVNPT